MANLTQLIGGAQELHAYSVRRLYNALAEDISQVSFPPTQAQGCPTTPLPILGGLLLILDSNFSLKITATYIVQKTSKHRALFLRTSGLLS